MTIRLDNFLAEKENISRTKAQDLVKKGCVNVNGKVVDKPSFLVEESDQISFETQENYVSRGAYKLKKAIETFHVCLKDKVVLDMGASTGGFTQVSLENGAKKVYSVDVGKGELAKVLAIDPRVNNMEGCDIRNVTFDMVSDTEIVVGDLSFISLKHILPKLNSLFGKIQCVLLFKPQFECGKEIAKKMRGVIKDKAVHKKLLKEFCEEIKGYDFFISDMTFSPIKGKNGNIEYLIHLNYENIKNVDIEKIVNQAFDIHR